MSDRAGDAPMWAWTSSEPSAWSHPAAVDWEAKPSIDSVVDIDIDQRLVNARVIGDATEVDGRDWWFQTRTAARYLRIESLSFPAQIYLDGVEIGSARSSFLPVEIDLPGRECELVIVCRSLSEWLSTKRPRGRWRSSLTGSQGLRWARVSLVGRVAAYAGPPPLVGFRGLALGDRPTIRNLAISTRLAGEIESSPPYGEIRVRAEVQGDPQADLSATLSIDGHVVAQQAIGRSGQVDVRFGVDRPRLWWPHGYGDPACYEVCLTAGDHEVVRRTVGFRRVSIDRADGGFALAVNGVPIFARGAVLTGPTDADVIDTLADSGATMVRVAGGTAAATADVWERCARRGILVWHDSMVSTFDVPGELHELIGDELRALLSSYGSNPALVVVCGGSETRQQPEMFGRDANQRDQPLIEQVLPDVVDEWLAAGLHGNGDLVYVDSSPSSGTGASVLRPDDGPSHWFGVGGYRQPLTSVVSAGVRFASECLAFAIPPDEVSDLTAVANMTEGWKCGVARDHGASWDFEDVRDHYVRELFDVDPAALRLADPGRYLQLGRAAVAEAMTTCFAFWRSAPESAGALVLSAQDLAPGSGWGLLDSQGRSKAPLRALRRVWAPVALTVVDDGLAGLAIAVHNDTAQAVSGWIELRATNSRAQVTVEGRLPVRLDPSSSLKLHDGDVVGRFTDLAFAYRFGDPVAESVDVRLVADDGRMIARDAHVIDADPGRAHSAPPREMTAVLDRDAGMLRLMASSALRWVSVDLPGLQTADDYFHLAGGIEYAVPVRAADARAGRLPPVSLTGERAEVRSVDLTSPIPVTDLSATDD